MAVSIAQAQKAYNFSEGSTDYIRFTNATNAFEQFGIKFIKELAVSADKNKVVASGELLRNVEYKISEDGKSMQIMIADYFDYPNEGVKGWGSSKNAPNSPYQYKKGKRNGKPNYNAILNSGFGKSISKYIDQGHAKIANVQNDKAKGIGLEKKKLSLQETGTLTLMYLIKRYGVKATHYFDEAVKETFKDFEFKMSEAIGKDIIFTIEKINRK